MDFSTYSELQDALASLLHREGDTTLTPHIPAFIRLAETEMQRKLKLVEFEASGTVTLTDGVGSLPADFVGMRAIYWDGNTARPLTYTTPDRINALKVNSGGTPGYYSITGSSLLVDERGSGDAVMTYSAKFTQLSDSNTTSSLLSNHPDAYLYGALKHACVFTQDEAGLQKFGILFNAACDSIKSNNSDRKYAGPLQVRAR